MKNIIAITLLIVVALTGGFFLMRGANFTPATGSTNNKADVGGIFTLTDQNGKTFTEQNLKGKYSLVFFGFTNCPDVCPTTLTMVTQLMGLLGNQSSKLLPVFISVDSGSDTPATMKIYLSNFHPAIIGLTGTEAQIKEAAQSYKAYYAKVDQPDSTHGYTMDHSAFLYFMDKNGQYVAHFNYDDSPEKISAAIKPTLEQ
jgi:cytochrome oxidase Cu insertion factor (SCO1/SenC/PrrC family)